MVMPVGSRKGRILANGTHCKIPALQSSDKDPKTYSESRALLTAICDWEFIFGLCVQKVILSNTNSLCLYLQGKTVDVISPRRNADHSDPMPVSE